MVVCTDVNIQPLKSAFICTCADSLTDDDEEDETKEIMRDEPGISGCCRQQLLSNRFFPKFHNIEEHWGLVFRGVKASINFLTNFSTNLIIPHTNCLSWPGVRCNQGRVDSREMLHNPKYHL